MLRNRYERVKFNASLTM